MIQEALDEGRTDAAETFRLAMNREHYHLGLFTEALKEFERGVKLTRQCQSALQQAEQKVEILLKKTEQAEAVPFEPEEDDET